jgi:nucleotide-binding universal stress UspA family protein
LHSEPDQYRAFSAVEDFHRARQQAGLRQVLARLTGRSVDLLSYEMVTRRLGHLGSAERGLRDIPIDAIAGSVGRTNDFTRDFLPRQDADVDRWTRVKLLASDPHAGGLPPIRVYQVGEAYFVIDGHHRVSVARQLGATHIQAYVTEVRTRVPLSATATPEEVIAKAEQAEFLEATELDRSRPALDFAVSDPGEVRHLLGHIQAHQRYLAESRNTGVPLPEAAADWADFVYLPVVQVIREQGLPRDFPGRTEADLYLLLSAHRAELEAALGWEIAPEVGATDLAARQSRERTAPVVRAGRRLLSAVVPDELKPGPAPGQWRRERLAARYADRLFSDILVPVSGEPIGWVGLDQALALAGPEQARLHGLHVVPDTAQQASPEARAIREEFSRRCQAAGVSGSLAIEVGEVARRVCELAALNDLVVLNLAYPPAPQLLARLGSGFRAIIRRCPRPVLAVPQAIPTIDRIILAYDGSPKAEEALFVAAYLGESRSTPVTVVTIKQPEFAADAIVAHAREYLELHEVPVTLVVRESGSLAEAVCGLTHDVEGSLVITGGYGANPVLEALVGSAVDQVLRETRRPVLICQ